MTSFATARDIMLADATNAAGAVPISYDDNPPEGITIDGTAPWMRATVKHAGGGQQGFGDGISSYLRIGTFCVEIFTPVGDNMVQQDALVEQVVTYIEARKSYPVWYRNIRAADAGRDGGYQKINVYADFEFESNH